ncbi:hypothetical protein ABB37_02942 [Leptomonas pyrrhocoris]|uniref:C3H1-type domain-containing protein n=1 Tax=Leptomonas pyrrhocoris TaxID=157538 RepID=A0A0N0DXQ9_LEPPY|nr:hypothetical protein ABB37_02942 [Leptomonas pyrrhocoris]KPA83265.1 hypothetical protein ABB37_02942 [Leptomonas pyrrhocoris]|eukprot:XP_015661704.1 hypothetical protein ABB37_02942 [Leptomonas pyrrhocoris]
MKHNAAHTPGAQSSALGHEPTKPTPVHDGNKEEAKGKPQLTSSRIDSTKYKTKLCRHFARGLPCPFGEHCAFSHGEDLATMGPKDLTSMPTSPLNTKARCYTPETASLTGEDGNSMENSAHFRVRFRSLSRSHSQQHMQPPPSYEAAVTTAEGATSSAAVPPPSYPRRYRFDPYSADTIVYVRG